MQATYLAVLILGSICSILAIVPVSRSGNGHYYDLKDAPQLFEKFIKDYDRHYQSDAEFYYRYKVFKDNLIEANELNSKSDSAVFGITQFSDMKKDEVPFGLGPVPIQ